MITKADCERIWEGVKANQAALKSCSLHTFVDVTPEKTLSKRWRCASCGGELDTVNRAYYELGLAHGRAEQ